MDAKEKAEKILKDLKYDFANFTLDGFFAGVGQVTQREIISIPWQMPATLFGAWISDGERPREYIFYRSTVPEIHQIHIQLHELSHFLLGHSTLIVTQKMIAEIVAGTVTLSLEDLPNLRSPKTANLETEAEVLANLIQKQVFQYASLSQLTSNLSAGQKFADFVKTMRLD